MYEDMKSSRQIFKLALRYCRENTEEIKANNIANSFNEKDNKTFWNHVNSKFSKNNCSASVVENISAKEKYFTILER